MEEIGCGGSPYESDDAFGDHCSIEDGAAMALIGDAACHEW